jgi:hypothetical protein
MEYPCLGDENTGYKADTRSSNEKKYQSIKKIEAPRHINRQKS